MNAYSERFKEIRKVLNLSQIKIAEKLEIASSVIGDIERGTKEPSRALILALASKININPNWVLLGIEPMFLDQPSIKEDSGSKEVEELRKALEEKDNQLKEIMKDPNVIKAQKYEQEIADLKKSIDEIQKEYDEIKAETSQSVEQLKDKVISLQEQLLLRNTGTNTI
ncbi:MAG: helix-turn-helix domain-containing protein [Spirochaetales bacterium]|nr:helix-turn-helix domain-containing protein [Spirochaetales bacterium]